MCEQHVIFRKLMVYLEAVCHLGERDQEINDYTDPHQSSVAQHLQSSQPRGDRRWTTACEVVVLQGRFPEAIQGQRTFPGERHTDCMWHIWSNTSCGSAAPQLAWQLRGEREGKKAGQCSEADPSRPPPWDNLPKGLKDFEMQNNPETEIPEGTEGEVTPRFADFWHPDMLDIALIS